MFGKDARSRAKRERNEEAFRFLERQAWTSACQRQRIRREQGFHADALGDDALLQRVIDHLADRLPVGFQAVGHGVFAGDFHHALMHFIDSIGFGNLPGLLTSNLSSNKKRESDCQQSHNYDVDKH